MKVRVAISALLLLSLCAMTGIVQNSAAQSSSDGAAVQLITVSAQKYHFDPSEIRVTAGTTVRLKITQDHAHGFKINLTPENDRGGEPGLVFSSPQECVKIDEGQTTTVEFVAKKPGTYPFRCCVRCGWHHHAMKGQVVVEP